MVQINPNYLHLSEGYLFPEIARRVEDYLEKNPEAKTSLIRCGIGDVTEPLVPSVINALQKAVEDLSTRENFYGYGPERGYLFLREKIVQNSFSALNISAEEIFVSDGSKCDTANILDILGPNLKIGVSDPVYPVYVDTNVMVGNGGEKRDSEYANISYFRCTEENDFLPQIPSSSVNVIYLCSPNNPTGTVATHKNLEKWVKFALKNEALLLFDSAYESFISDDSLPHSIYEIPEAKECAIEFRSFSKHGGFTGIRCAYTVVPKDLFGKDKKGKLHSLHQLWSRRQSTKFNGASYLSQRAAESLFSVQGKKETEQRIAYYLKNAFLLKEACQRANLVSFGGENAPYVWGRCPEGMRSWEFFDFLLRKQNIVCTPGAGFGRSGEGYFRLSSFNSRENIKEVVRRFSKLPFPS